MASPVPYEGAPTVQPGGAPIQPERVDTPIAAFGGLVAEATQHLGQVSEQAGDELFQRGYAMQQMNQQAEADKASAQYSNDLTNSYLDFTSKKGQDAVNAFPAFAQQTEDMRTQAAGNLNSPYAQLIFNQDSRNFRSRVMFSAGIHAKEQNQAFVKDGLTAQINAQGFAIGASPDDDAGFQSGLSKVKSAALQRSMIDSGVHDPNDPINATAVATEASKYSYTRLIGLAKEQPFRAEDELDKLQKSGDITSFDAQRADEYITNQRRGVGARMGAATVMAGNNNQFGEGVLDNDRLLAGAKAAEGGNYGFQGADSTNKQGQTGHPLGAYSVMSYNLPNFLSQAGMQPMSEQEFLQNKAAQDQLAGSMLGKYQQQYGSANKAIAKWLGALDADGNYTSARDSNGTGAQDEITRFNAGVARASNLKQLTDAGSAYATKMAPDDPMLGDLVNSHIERINNEDQAIQKNDEFNNMNSIYTAIVTGGQNGKIPTSEADLKAALGPKADSLDALQGADRLKVDRILAQNAKGDFAMTPQALQEYGRLYGEALNEPDKFVNEDIASKAMPWSTRKELLGMQAKVFSKAYDNPQLSHALGFLSPMLGSAGLTKAEDPDGYNQFTGALHGEMQDYMAEHKRLPRDDDLQKMGARLLQRQGAGWFSSGTPLYGSQAPDEYKAMAGKAFDAQGVPAGPERDQMINQMWVRQQYQRLYGKTDSGPAVPNE